MIARVVRAKDVAMGSYVLDAEPNTFDPHEPSIALHRVIYTLFNDDMYATEGIWLASTANGQTTDEFLIKYPSTYAMPSADIQCKADDLLVVF